MIADLGINLDVNQLAMGGPVVEEGNADLTDGIPHIDYRVIPANFKTQISTRLKGSFYVNPLGKVYYEPDKPLTIKGEAEGKPLACSVTPEPDYTFEHEIGKIVKYNGNAEHLVIPSYFLVNGECWPVRIIGKAAFMQGNFRSIVIPETVWIIEENAFKDIELSTIYVPGSVTEVGPGAFDGNYEVIYGGSSNQVIWHGGSYTQPGGGSGSIIYKPPSNGSGGIIFKPNNSGGVTIINGGNNSGYIPPYVIINGEEMPVTEIAKGAYQGLGLITVVLPETLEIIEDYAFAGNQLIGVTIPNGVKYIGYYAFSFNERWKVGNLPGPDRIATIKSIIIYSSCIIMCLVDKF